MTDTVSLEAATPAAKRQRVQQHCLQRIEALAGAKNKALYEKLFAQLDDSAFAKFMDDLKSGAKKLAVVNENFASWRINKDNNLKLAKEWGHQFFQRVWVPAKGTSPSFLTPNPYLVLELPMRRQAQLLEKKISIPKHNNSVDYFTGQPTGDSKGSKISYPETQVLAALGLNHSLKELLKFRGGDERGFNAFNTMISRSGGASLKALEPFAGGVKSTQTLRVMLTAMMLKNTL